MPVLPIAEMDRRVVKLLLKIVVSLAILGLIYRKVLGREGADQLGAVLADVSWPWLLAAAGMQLGAIVVSVLRWDRLLLGQGIRAPKRHLFGSFMIGRFFGAFTPGGWTGLNGYRLYDIAHHTGKTARSTATIGIEMVLGQLALSAVVVAGSIAGFELLGLQGVLLVDGFFIALITVAIVLISRPGIFVAISGRLPEQIRARLQTTLDAVFAYEGKGALVAQAALLGMGTHAFNNLIYVCTAHALGVRLSVGIVFFGASLQIFSTLLPVSLNGIGLREATAVALYTSVGVPASVAVLIPTVGFAVEMCVSAFGGLVFVGRRTGYSVDIEVQDPEREDTVRQQIEFAPASAWPKVGRGALLGAAGGLLGGALLGLAEAGVTLAGSAAAPDLHVLWYGALAYGILGLPIGLGGGLVLAWTGRLIKRPAVPEPVALARMAALLVALLGLPIAAFRLRRDYYHEELVWKSAEGLLVFGGCALGALVVFALLSLLLTALGRSSAGAFLLRPWGAPAALGGLLVLLFGLAGALTTPASSLAEVSRPDAAAPEGAGNVLVIVVDTLRADFLPAYGHGGVKTPHLDAFLEDAARFDQAFSNASWTRPSFASILSGRYPSSHNTMSKAASLPDDLTTWAEAMKGGGYTTMGVVTNYNVAPFFNFHQGFDRYTYLEPNFVLGANDTAAKLLFVQAARRVIEKLDELRGIVEAGGAYQDANHVNAEILAMLDEKPPEPWFMFAGYMDPHDPYFPHPYDGTGYSRAANQKPRPEEAAALRALYEGEIEFWDAKFGELVAALKQRGVYDDLTIVITSDHGEEFMEHGGFWHGTTLYDEQVRVPLLVKFPGGRLAGSAVDHWVQSIDLMPSVLALQGLAVPAGVQGKQLSQDAPQVFAEESHEGNVLRALRLRSEGMPMKLIEANPGNPRGLAERELYDLLSDPGEQDNLAGSDARRLSLAQETMAKVAESAKHGAAAAKQVDLSADSGTMNRLQKLGYVDEAAPPDEAKQPDGG